MTDNLAQSKSIHRFSISVREFSRKECPFSNRLHTTEQFHTFRNSVLEVLSRYGTVGPAGKISIVDGETEYERTPHISGNPDFFVVDDDMYGLSVRVETSWTLVKAVLLEELAMDLNQFKEWAVYLAVIKGGLFVFHNLIMFEGDLFAGCKSLEELYDRCAHEKS